MRPDIICLLFQLAIQPLEEPAGNSDSVEREMKGKSFVESCSAYLAMLVREQRSKSDRGENLGLDGQKSVAVPFCLQQELLLLFLICVC